MVGVNSYLSLDDNLPRLSVFSTIKVDRTCLSFLKPYAGPSLAFHKSDVMKV